MGYWRVLPGVGNLKLRRVTGLGECGVGTLVCVAGATTPAACAAVERVGAGFRRLSGRRWSSRRSGSRTKAGYARVLDGFRAIYHANPRDAHAADAVNAVAEVLAEQGREFDDEKSLQAAIGAV